MKDGTLAYLRPHGWRSSSHERLRPNKPLYVAVQIAAALKPALVVVPGVAAAYVLERIMNAYVRADEEQYR